LNKSNLILIEKEIYDELASATMGFIVKFFENGQIRVLLFRWFFMKKYINGFL